MAAQFLNLDVTIRSKFDLLPLRQELGNHVDVLFCGETEPGNFLLSIELEAGAFYDSGPDEKAKALCKLIEDLTGSAQEAWASADDRVFDVGFEAVLDPCGEQPLLSPEALQQIGRLKARLALSIYTFNLQSAV